MHDTDSHQLPYDLLSVALDKNIMGIIILDDSNNILFWNDWIQKTSQITKEQALYKNIFDVFPEIKDSRIHNAIELSVAKGTASFISHAFNKKIFPLYINGDKTKIISQLIHINPIQTENKNRYCYIQIDDATSSVAREKQLRKMAHEAETLSRLKSGFIASVSHELRTPLTSILGALNLLITGTIKSDSDDGKNMLNIAYNNSERLLLLISDILDLEKISSGKMELNMTDIDMNDLIKSSIIENTGLASKYKVKFLFNHTDSLPLVHADSNRIIQVLNNLLSNAAKFEPDNGQIIIEAVVSDQNLKVSITDHGPGIPAEFQSTIFESFTQADVSDAKSTGGTGLGLSISKEIIQLHNGQINFTSEPNQGTCFFFTLPLN